MVTVESILKIVGRKTLAARLGHVNERAVGNASTANSFPASWYPTVKELAQENYIFVPDDLFNWRKAKRSEEIIEPDAEAG